MTNFSRRAFALSAAALVMTGCKDEKQPDAADFEPDVNNITELVVKYNNKHYWLSYQDPQNIQAIQEVTPEEADDLSGKEVLLDDGTAVIISIGIFTVEPDSPQAQAIDRAIAAGVGIDPAPQP